MDYSKSGAPKGPKNKPRHKEHNQKGSSKNPFGGRPDKSAFLDRMKAALQAREDKAQ